MKETSDQEFAKLRYTKKKKKKSFSKVIFYLLNKKLNTHILYFNTQSTLLDSFHHTKEFCLNNYNTW